jgi:hypothetical protein
MQNRGSAGTRTHDLLRGRQCFNSQNYAVQMKQATYGFAVTGNFFTIGKDGLTTPAADPEVDASTRSGSGKASGDAAADDAPRSGTVDGIGFRVSDRNSGPFSLWETDRQLCRAGPEENSSGDRRRLGHISKQGNALLRFLLVEAAQVTARSQPQWGSKFFHLAMRRGRKIAKVAMARKLAVHLYWMWRQGHDYGQSQKFGSQGRKLSFHTVLTITDVMIGHPAPFETGEFEQVIMIAVVIEEMAGSD